MSNSYENFKTLVERKKQKYPNICKLWEGHVNEKKNIYQITLEKAINVLNTIESKSEKDLPMETIAFLYFLFQEDMP